MKPPFQSDEFEFILSPTNYLHINCKQCGAEVAVEYQGLDPTMPQLGLSCGKCKTSATVKIFNPDALKGFHPDPL